MQTILQAYGKNLKENLITRGVLSPVQYSCLENPMDGGDWWAVVHGVAKSLTWLSDFTFTFHFHALEKEMATHSSVLAWRIPGTAEPGELPSMGSHGVGHDWSDLAAAAAEVLSWVIWVPTLLSEVFLSSSSSPSFSSSYSPLLLPKKELLIHPYSLNLHTHTKTQAHPRVCTHRHA